MPKATRIKHFEKTAINKLGLTEKLYLIIIFTIFNTIFFYVLSSNRYLNIENTNVTKKK